MAYMYTLYGMHIAYMYVYAWYMLHTCYGKSPNFGNPRIDVVQTFMACVLNSFITT